MASDGKPRRAREEELTPATDLGSIIDQLTADKGWTLEYALCLTFRQTEAVYERYWDRKVFELRLMSRTINPIASPDGGSAGPAVIHHDASTDEGFAEAVKAINIPIGRKPARQIS